MKRGEGSLNGKALPLMANTGDIVVRGGVTREASTVGFITEVSTAEFTLSRSGGVAVRGIVAVVGVLSRNLADLQEREGSYLSIYDQPSTAPVARDPVISLIHASVDKLTRSTNFLQFLGQHALIVQADAPTSEEADQVADEKYHFMSLLLNLASTYLYMVNTYIIVPTADDYLVSLGAAATVCGVVIGSMAVAQVFSSVYFSAWSNRSYFRPLVFSNTMLVLGNILYALAYNLDSLTIFLIGRLLCEQILLGSEILVLAGILLSFKFTSSYMVPQYVCSALITFVAAKVLEGAGVNLSLLSQVMSSRLARGTYNGGLLSTKAGTLARVVADDTITLVGYLGESKLLNVTLFPSLLNCISSIAATCLTYNSLF
ncbi:hypothetical protein Cni_G19228 [Canna indica]|uniref:Uncharacterized protein n=1 Tax=Canna indica TaxID=4628 RepID=A0AAQ3QIC0_9LILI|nr:hypothetical protein Cni_G19228 [Canna indica]